MIDDRTSSEIISCSV